MEVKITTKKIKCDLGGCGNLAEYSMSLKKHFLSSEMYFCKKCLNKMYSSIGKIVVPASVKNVYKKNNIVGDKNAEKPKK